MSLSQSLSKSFRLLLLLVVLAATACARPTTTATHFASTQEDADALSLRFSGDAPSDGSLSGVWSGDVDDWHERPPSRVTLMKTSAAGAAEHGFSSSVRAVRQGEDWVVEGDVGVLRLRPAAGDDAEGAFEFTADDAFVAEHGRELSGAPDGATLLTCLFAGVDDDYVDVLTAADGGLSWADVVTLKRAGVTADFVARLRAPREPERDGASTVASQEETEAPAAEVRYSVDDLVRLSNYDVPADYITGMRDAGFQAGVDDLVRLHSYDVPLAYIVNLRRAGARFKTDELVRLHSYDVPEAYIVTLYEQGMSFGHQELVRLHSYDVPASYITGLQAAGYRFSPEELVRLNSYDVPLEYAVAIASPQRGLLSAAELIRLRMNDVKPELVQALRGE